MALLVQFSNPKSSLFMTIIKNNALISILILLSLTTACKSTKTELLVQPSTNTELKITKENITNGEFQTRTDIRNKVKSLFINEKFEELDEFAIELREQETRTSSGVWKLTQFYFAFDDSIFIKRNNRFYRAEIENKIYRWLAKQPNSAAAQIVKGLWISDKAWGYRGGGWASTVEKEDWKDFFATLEQAKQYMFEVKDNAHQDPHWYVVMANILKSLEVDMEEFNTVTGEGLKLFPSYYQLHFAITNYLSPKWHGNSAYVEAFANEAVNNSFKEEGFGMYSRIYWYSSQTQYDERLFMQSDINWDVMKAGMFDVLNRYPDEWNLQTFAFFSCLAGDRDTTAKLMNLMGSKPMIKAWKEAEYFNKCRAFAFPDNTI